MSYSLNIDGNLMFFDSPIVMGILNLTPDSFHAASRYAFDAVADADIVDIGACSTRPGAEVCSEREEIERLEAASDEINRRFSGKIISIDTFRPAVAERAVELFGAHIINDISGGDDEMFKTASRLKRAYVLTYPECGGTDKMLLWFSKKIDAIARAGVNDIIVDPGFGFNKDVEQNYAILRDMEALKSLRLPILCGVSRKRMAFQPLGITPAEALNGTTVLNTLMLERGADILRVHDVKEAKEAVKIFKLL